MKVPRGFATAKLVLGLAALPLAVGETTYVLMQAVHFDIGQVELFRVVGAVATAWMTFLTGLIWRTHQMTRADHHLLHGDPGRPGIVGDVGTVKEAVDKLPEEMERRLDVGLGKMEEWGSKLELRIERLETQRMERER